MVLFDSSTSCFHKFQTDYLHYFEQKSNTGLELDLLQKFLIIPLDIFRKIQHNKSITSKLDAWLLFFSSDDPDDIIRLITEYPEFGECYGNIFRRTQNLRSKHCAIND